MQIRPYLSGRDVLLTTGDLGEATFRLGEFPEFLPDEELYLWFDTPIPEEKILHGIGLFFAEMSTLKGLLADTLTASVIPRLATDDMVVRGLRSIRGPNSRDYRSLLLGELDSHGGDQVSLESLSGRRLLGRDIFDLNGADDAKVSDTSINYKTNDGSHAISSGNTPLTIYRDYTFTPQVTSPDFPAADFPFTPIATSVNVDFNKFITRFGVSPGPFTGTLLNGYILETESDTFYPTDAGLTVLVENTGPSIDIPSGYLQFMKVWSIERWVSPTRVILNSVDTPNKYLGAVTTSIEVQFTFGTRSARNLSGGATLRLDAATTDLDGALKVGQLNALVLTGSHGLTGIATARRTHIGSVDFYSKNEFTVTESQGNKLLVVGANILDTPEIVDLLCPYDGFEDAIVISEAENTNWQFSFISASNYSLKIPMRKHSPMTLVEVLTSKGDLDGLFILNSITCNYSGDLMITLQSLDGAVLDEEVIQGISGGDFSGHLRFYNMTLCQNLKHDQNSGLFGGVTKYKSAIDFSAIGLTGTNPTPHVSAARFTGFGELACVIDLAVTENLQPVYPAVAEGELLNSAGAGRYQMPYYGMEVTTTSPVDAGIKINTSSWTTTDGLKHENQAKGGSGIRITARNSSRAMLKKMAQLGDVPDSEGGVVSDSAVFPRAAGLVVQQVNYQGGTDNDFVDDPVYRDPAAIFAGTVTEETSLGEKITGGLDSNAVVVSYLHEDVYQTSMQQIRWAVTLYNPEDTSNSVKIFRTTKGGELGECVIQIVPGASPGVTFNGVTLLVTVTVGWPTIVQLRTQILADFPDDFECSSIVGDGTWHVTAECLAVSGSDTLSFTPDGITQLDSNAAIETLNGDVVITDGILKLSSKSARLCGIGSDLIPVNQAEGYPWPRQEINAEILPLVGFNLGEEKIYLTHEEEDGTIAGAVLTLSSSEFIESDVGRKLKIVTTFGETETTYYRFIAGISAGNIILNEYLYPVVAWDSIKVTVYGRRWANVYAKNVETDTLTATAISATSIYGDSILTPTLTVTETATIDSADINVAEVTVLSVTGFLNVASQRLETFIPSTSFASRGTFRRIYDNFDREVVPLGGQAEQSQILMTPHDQRLTLDDLQITAGDLLRIHKPVDETLDIDDMSLPPTITEYEISSIESSEDWLLQVDRPLPRTLTAELYSVVRWVDTDLNKYPAIWNTWVSGRDPQFPGIEISVMLFDPNQMYSDILEAHRILTYNLYPSELPAKIGQHDVKISSIAFVFAGIGVEDKSVTVLLHKMTVDTQDGLVPLRHPVYLQSALDEAISAERASIVTLTPYVSNLGVADIWNFACNRESLLEYLQIEVQIPHNTEFIGARVFYEQT